MIAIISNKQSWAWGQPDNGRLGDNTLTGKSSPILIVGSHNFIQVIIGSFGSSGLKVNGELWTWGGNFTGQLGDNTITDKSSPILVVGGHSFIFTCIANSARYALKADGTAWSWGGGTNGQLGDGTAVAKSSPVLVSGGHSFIQIFGGDGHVIALRGDGTAWCWGQGTAGRLGTNTTTNRTTPTAVVGGHTFIAVGIGGSSSYGLKADGSVWSWGSGLTGQLGNNSTASRSSPVAVVGGHSFIQIGVKGSQHTIALKANGEAWCWGSAAFYGQLGDNTTSNKSSPILVVGGHSFIQVFAWINSSYGLKANGELWAWGQNDTGQLGDNTLNSKSSPVLVVGNFNFKNLPTTFFVPSNTEDLAETIIITDSISAQNTFEEELINLIISDSIIVEYSSSEEIAETLEVSDLINIQDTLEELSDSVEISDIILVTNANSDAFLGTKILSINPLIFVTNTNPVEIIKVDTTDPENLDWEVRQLTGLTNALDAIIGMDGTYIYVAGANGKIAKVQVSDISIFSIIDLNDTDNIKGIEHLDNIGITYAITDNSLGELYLIDERTTVILDSNVVTIAPQFSIFDSNINCIQAKVMDSKCYVLEITPNILNSKFNCLSVGVDPDNEDVPILDQITPIKRTDFHVYLDDVELNDVDLVLSSINITHTVDEKSAATFILTRRHDNLNYDKAGIYRQITNQNEIKIYIKTQLVFEGTISNIDAQYTDTEQVVIQVEGTIPSYNYTNLALSLPSFDERLGLYDVLIHNPQISNPLIDAEEVNPRKYKGVFVPLGKQITQSISRFIEFDGSGDIAEKIQTGEFRPKQNWTYYWSPTVQHIASQIRKTATSNTAFTNFINDAGETFAIPQDKLNDFKLQFIKDINFLLNPSQFVALGDVSSIYFDYIGTSLSPISEDLWLLKNAKHRKQRIYADKIIRLGTGYITKTQIEELNIGNETTLFNALVSAGYINSSGIVLTTFTNEIFESEDLNIPYSNTIKEALYNLLDNSFGIYLGVAPFKPISVRSGIFIPKARLQDEDNGLYSIVDENYNFTAYCQTIAALEYEKIQNINGAILPDVSCTMELTLDAYQYFGFKILNRINIENTIESNIYKNSNGFPVSIKSINISSDSMRVHLTTDNQKSTPELEEIDGRFPTEDDYINEAKRTLIALKTDMNSRIKVI